MALPIAVGAGLFRRTFTMPPIRRPVPSRLPEQDPRRGSIAAFRRPGTKVNTIPDRRMNPEEPPEDAARPTGSWLAGSSDGMRRTGRDLACDGG